MARKIDSKSKTPASSRAVKSTAKPAAAAGAHPVASENTAPEAMTPSSGTMGLEPAKKPARKAAAAPKRAAAISDEDIALRAYFIAEQRIREGRAGDDISDWTEAERQLKAERGSKARKATA